MSNQQRTHGAIRAGALLFALSGWAARAEGQVLVTPDGTSIASQFNHQTGLSYGSFRVWNEGTSAGTWNLSCVGASSVTCTNWPSSVTVPASSFVFVTVTYNTGNEGTGQLYLTASNAGSSDQGYVVVPVILQSGTPKMSVLPYLEAKQDYGRCAAGCFAATYGQSTVPYVSLDAPRNVTLVYHGDRVAPRPFVLVDVRPDSSFGGGFPSEYQMQVMINGALVTFVNGEQTLRFSNPASKNYRIGGQFVATGYTHGSVYPMEILVSGKIGANLYTNRWITQYLHVDEAASTIARGWTVAGIQRAFPVVGTGVLVTEGDGSATYFKWNAYSAKYEAPVGDFSAMSYNGINWLRTYPDSTKVTFDGTGKMTTIADRWGSATTVLYDVSGTKITQVKDPLNNAIVFTYDANGLDYITDPFGRVTQVTVATGGSRVLTAIQDPDLVSTTFGYDGSNRLRTITDRRAKTRGLAYQVINAIETNKVAADTAPAIPVNTGGTARPVTAYAPWHTKGVPYAATAVTAYTPPLVDSAYATVTEPLGASYLTKFTVNRWGSPRWSLNPFNEATTIVYTVNGQSASVLKPGFGGVKDTLAYNGSGLLTYSKPAGDSVTTIGYGGWAQAQTVTTGGRPVVTYGIGANGRVSSVSWGGITRESYTYDSYGRLAALVDGVGTTLRTMAFFASGTHRNTQTVTIPGSRTTTFSYDSYGRNTSLVRPDNVTEQTYFSAINRVDSTRVLTSPITVTKYQYDNLFLTAVIDPKNQSYTYVYNDLGWLIRQKGPADAGTIRDTLQYNVGGELKRWTNRRGQNIDYGYDVLHRMTSRTAGLETMSVSYTANSLNTTATTSGSLSTTVAMFPSLVGAPDSVKTTLNGNVFKERFKYTSSGLDSVFFTGSTDEAHLTARKYVYNGSHGALSDVRLNGVSSTTITRDNALTPTSYVLPGGGTITVGPNSLEAPNKYTAEAANNASLERWMGFTALGQIDRHLQHTAKIGRWFTYDSLGQLRTGRKRNRIPDAIPGGCPNFDTGMSGSCTPGADYNTLDSTLYTYDAVGNRTDKGGTYGNANRVLTFDNCSYTTDAEGNVTSRTGASCATPLSGIAWTPLGQLDSLIQGANKVKFFYDALGRLVAKRLNGTLQSYFLWDGDNLLAELNNTASAVVTEYSYYGPDVLHAVIKQPGKLKYFARVDGLGNVLALTDTTSAIKRDYGWDDWGKQTSGTDNASFNGTDRARWKGALWMGSEVDLYYMRNRWYEPATGRFLSEDPIGLAGGINNVVFAGGDPVNASDPDGLATRCYDVYESTIVTKGLSSYVASTRFLYDYCVGEAYDGPNLGPTRSAGGRGRARVLTLQDAMRQLARATRPAELVRSAEDCFIDNTAWMGREVAASLAPIAAGTSAGLSAGGAAAWAHARGVVRDAFGRGDRSAFTRGGVATVSAAIPFLRAGARLVRGGILSAAVPVYIGASGAICRLAPNYGT